MLGTFFRTAPVVPQKSANALVIVYPFQNVSVLPALFISSLHALPDRDEHIHGSGMNLDEVRMPVVDRCTRRIIQCVRHVETKVILAKT